MSEPIKPAAEAGPATELSLDELEHQALDLLDELRCGTAWIAAQQAQDEVSNLDEAGGAPGRAALEAAIIEAGEEPGEVAEAEEQARAALLRVVTQVAASLLDAARDLAETEARGELATAQLDEAREILNASPELSPAMAPAVETSAVILGLDRRSIAWAMLISLGEGAHARAPELLRACSQAIAERLQAAHPQPLPEGEELPAAEAVAVSRALRVFRSAAVTLAGPKIRARLLAAGAPDQLELAGALVERHRDPLALVEAFDRARAEAQREAQDQAEDPTEDTDGPKRKFTWLHLILAMVVLGLTLWHYLWR